MSEEQPIRDLFNTPEAMNFVYRPPKHDGPQALNVTIGVKFARGVHFLDFYGFMLIGKTRWQRIVFRIKHPIVYSKRGLINLYRKIKRIFVKEKRVRCIK